MSKKSRPEVQSENGTAATMDRLPKGKTNTRGLVCGKRESLRYGKDGDAYAVETYADKFQRLANYRMPRLLKRLRQIKALANKSQYDFSSEQVGKIVNAIHKELEDIAMAFQGQKKSAESWSL